MKFLLNSYLTAIVALSASAMTPANTDEQPGGNAISQPGPNDSLVAGEPYTMSWTPDTGDHVSLVLLRGPPNNVVPIMTIADNIPNSGSYTWDLVPRDLEADTTGYAIQLIVEGTGAYQYSTQFGVENEASTETTPDAETSPDAETVADADTDTDADTEIIPDAGAEYVPGDVNTTDEPGSTTVTVESLASSIPVASDSAETDIEAPAHESEVIDSAAATPAPSTLETDDKVVPGPDGLEYDGAAESPAPYSPEADSDSIVPDVSPDNLIVPDVSSDNSTNSTVGNSSTTDPITMFTGAAAPLAKALDGGAVLAILAGVAGILAL